MVARLGAGRKFAYICFVRRVKAVRRKSVDYPSDQRCTSPLSVVVAFCWKDVWHEHNTQKMVAGDNTVALVSPLKPATSYHFRVLAENHLGTSAPSDILHVSIKHFSMSQKKKKEKKKKESKFYHCIILCPSIRSVRKRPPFRLTLSSFPFSLGPRVSVRSNKKRPRQRKPTTQQAQTDGEIPGGPPRHVIAEPLGPQQVKVTWQPPDRSLWNGELLGYTISCTNLGYRYPLTAI